MKPYPITLAALVLIATSCVTRAFNDSASTDSSNAQQVRVEFLKLGSALQVVNQWVPGERVAIRLCGLQAQGTYRLQVAMGNASVFLRSWGDFVANGAGCITTDGQAPQAGSYQGVDVDGLFWSMAKSDAARISLQPGSYDVRLFEASGHEILATKLPIKLVGDGIQVRQISLEESGFVGRLFLPSQAKAGPVVVTISGSEGGVESSAWTAAALANEGVPALAVGYFGLPGLPQNLANIPLEYFAKSFEFLKSVPSLAGRSIVMMGPSRGSELSLLIGATFPQVAGVVAVVPSPYVWGGNTDGTRVPAWTYRGQGVPFLFTIGNLEPHMGADGVSAFSNKPAFDRALNAIPLNQRPTIWLENIKGPVLLLGASDDQMWPSCQGAAEALAKLKETNHPYADAAECYANAGHDLGVPSFSTVARSVFHPFMGVDVAMGGTAEGTGRGRRAAWMRTLQFLSEIGR